MDSGQLPRKDIVARTFAFSLRIIKLVNNLPKTPAGYAIGDQVVRSGTSIGANIEEAQDAASRKDFIHCLTISLKEARETHYWLKLIAESKMIKKGRLDSLVTENQELIKILTSIVKNTKKK